MNTLYFKHIRLLIAGFVFSLPLLVQAQKEHNWLAPVYLTVDEETVVFDENASMHIRFEVEVPSGVVSTNIVPLEEEGIKIKEISRSGGAKDGRIDVDIIVRCSEVAAPARQPIKVADRIVAQRIKVFEIQHITVDNISGVYVGNPVPPSAHARIAHASLSQGQNSSNPQASTGGVTNVTTTAILSGLQAVVTPPSEQVSPRMTVNASDVTLYPVPVRDGLLNIRIPESFGNVSSVAVHTMLGSLVKQTGPHTTTGEPIQLSLHELNAGVYFIRIQTQSGEVVKKINIGK